MLTAIIHNNKNSYKPIVYNDKYISLPSFISLKKLKNKEDNVNGKYKAN